MFQVQKGSLPASRSSIKSPGYSRRGVIDARSREAFMSDKNKSPPKSPKSPKYYNNDCHPTNPPLGTLKRMAKARGIAIPKADLTSLYLKREIYLHSIVKFVEDTLNMFTNRYTMTQAHEKLFTAIAQKEKVSGIDLSGVDCIYIKRYKLAIKLTDSKSDNAKVVTIASVLGTSQNNAKATNMPKDVRHWNCKARQGFSIALACIHKYVTDACKESMECYGVGFSNRVQMKGLPARLLSEFAKLLSEHDAKVKKTSSNNNKDNTTNNMDIELPSVIRLKAYVVTPLTMAHRIITEVAKEATGATKDKAVHSANLVQGILFKINAASSTDDEEALDQAMHEFKDISLRNISDLKEMLTIASDLTRTRQKLAWLTQVDLDNNKRVLFDIDYRNLLASTDHLGNSLINAVFSKAADAMITIRQTANSIKADHDIMTKTINKYQGINY